jgi:hypothetical protein
MPGPNRHRLRGMQLVELVVIATAAALQSPYGHAQTTGKASPAQTLPSARDVSLGLDGRRTDVQRDAYWATVKGKEVRWVLQVDEVTTGWFSGFKVRGMVSPTLLVSCEMEDKPATKAIVAGINKGDRVICVGKLGQTFVALFGMATVIVDGAIDR